MIFSSHMLLVFASVGLLFLVLVLSFQFYRAQKTHGEIGIRNYHSPLSAQSRIALFCGALVLFVAWVVAYGFQSSSELSTSARNVLFCLDVSKSMRVQDVLDTSSSPISRTEAAGQIAKTIIDAYPQNSYGVVVFAKTAVLLSPITQAHEYTKDILSSLSSKQVVQGSELGDTLAFCLDQVPPENQALSQVVYISDGGGDESSNINKAKLEQSRKVYSGSVSVVGLWTKQGGKIPLGTDMFNKVVYQKYAGQEVVAKADEENIKTLAGIARGEYIMLDSLGQMQEAKNLISHPSDFGKEMTVDTKQPYPLFWILFFFSFLSLSASYLLDYRRDIWAKH